MLLQLKKQLNCVSDADFAKKIGITSQTLSNWYARNTFDAEKIYTNCVGVSGDWLLSAEGEILKKSKPDVIEHSHNNKELLDRIERLSAENALLRRDIENLKNKDVRRNHEDHSSFPRAVTADAELRESTKNK